MDLDRRLYLRSLVVDRYTCRRCGEPKAAHVEVRWQGPPGRVDMALVCPREGLKAGALPADFFLPLLDDMEYQP